MEQSIKTYKEIRNEADFTDYIRLTVIKVLLSLIKRKDEYTANHCKRVMKLAVGYAKHYNYPSSEIKTLKYASLLHDIGKIIVPKKVLNKPDKLTVLEFDSIKKHPLAGFFIISKITFLENEAVIIKHHHERIDGLGYPYGLSGDELNNLSKVLSVCDAFDAMTNHRIYRKKLSHTAAVEELKINAGTQFDGNIVELFCSYLNSRISSRK